MTKEEKERIEAIAMDMWEPYAQVTRHNCPNAAIVYDFFHVVAKYSDVIDEVRRDEYRNASKEDARVIKGSRCQKFTYSKTISRQSGHQTTPKVCP